MNAIGKRQIEIPVERIKDRGWEGRPVWQTYLTEDERKHEEEMTAEAPPCRFLANALSYTYKLEYQPWPMHIKDIRYRDGQNVWVLIVSKKSARD